MNIYEKLNKVQSELKAPKGQYNSFGKYKYRSCEDILESVKPLLTENKLVLQLSDIIVSVEGRFYIKATAKLIDIEEPTIKIGENLVENSIQNFAFARESEKKTGMDESQITGTASSYARKYALNGLFLIDDTKEADTDEYHEQSNKKITKSQITKIKDLVDDIDAMLNYYKLDKLEDMLSSTATQIINRKTNDTKREDS